MNGRIEDVRDPRAEPRPESIEPKQRGHTDGDPAVKSDRRRAAAEDADADRPCDLAWRRVLAPGAPPDLFELVPPPPEHGKHSQRLVGDPGALGAGWGRASPGSCQAVRGPSRNRAARLEEYGRGLPARPREPARDLRRQEGRLDRRLHAARVAGRLARTHAPASIARKIAAVRTWMRFLVRRGHLEKSLAEELATPKVRRPLPTFLSADAAAEVVTAPGDDTAAHARDARSSSCSTARGFA